MKVTIHFWENVFRYINFIFYWEVSTLTRLSWNCVVKAVPRGVQDRVLNSLCELLLKMYSGKRKFTFVLELPWHQCTLKCCMFHFTSWELKVSLYTKYFISPMSMGWIPRSRGPVASDPLSSPLRIVLYMVLSLLKSISMSLTNTNGVLTCVLYNKSDVTIWAFTV